MEKGLTKEQSKALQGLAILMMLYHHLFSYPDLLGVSYKSLLNINGINVELKMAWFFKLCVGIYAFVSGYGLCKGVMKNSKDEETFGQKLKDDYLFVLRKLLSLFTQYWLVFVIFVPIGFIFFDKKFDFTEFIMNFLGIESSYNGAWWYMLQYMKFLFVFPIIDCLFARIKGIKARIPWAIVYGLIVVILGVVYFAGKDIFDGILTFIGFPFFLCFVVGYLLARFGVFEICQMMISKDILYFLGILGIFLVTAVRVKIAKDASSVGLDFIFVPILAFGFSILMDICKWALKFFMFFGSLSTFMWLTHVFYYDHYAKKIVMFSGFSLGIYLTLLALSVVTALVLNKIYGLISAKIKTIKNKNSK